MERRDLESRYLELLKRFVPARFHGYLPEMTRFVLVGVGTNLLGYTVFLLLTYAGIDHKYAMSGLYAIGMTLGFFWNRKWTFSHEGAFYGTLSRYLTAHLGAYLINLGLLVYLVDKRGYPYQLVQAFAIGVLTVFLFFSFKFFVFPSRNH